MAKKPKKSKESKALGKKPGDKPKRKTKPNKIDRAAVLVATQDPELNDYEIGKRIVDLGVCKHPSSVYKRLNRSDYLCGDIAEIRQNHRQTLTRELVPLAIQNTKKALKSDEIADSVKLGYTKMVMDKEFGEDRGPSVNVDKVEIQKLQVYQTLVSSNLDDAAKEAKGPRIPGLP